MIKVKTSGIMAEDVRILPVTLGLMVLGSANRANKGSVRLRRSFDGEKGLINSLCDRTFSWRLNEQGTAPMISGYSMSTFPIFVTDKRGGQARKI